LAGCATSGSHDKMLGYTDHNLFVVEHHDPAHGGRIVGTVCAVDLQLQAQHRRHGVRLSGLVDDRHANMEGITMGQELPVYLEARDRPGVGEREIFGAIGERPRLTWSSHSIDLKLTRDRLSGQVGARFFDLHVHGDDYVGSLRINDSHMPFVLRGAEQLWAMPAAAQATILPLLMSCDGPKSIIQVVDLRQSVGPPPSPPRWWAPAPSPAGGPMDRMSRPDAMPGPGRMPAATPRAPQMARVRA
jgi:hypothetical protein